MSAYYLEHASVLHVQKHFDFFEEEAWSLIASGLPIPAYVLQTLMIFPFTYTVFILPCFGCKLMFAKKMLGMISF